MQLVLGKDTTIGPLCVVQFEGHIHVHDNGFVFKTTYHDFLLHAHLGCPYYSSFNERLKRFVCRLIP